MNSNSTRACGQTRLHRRSWVPTCPTKIQALDTTWSCGIPRAGIHGIDQSAEVDVIQCGRVAFDIKRRRVCKLFIGRPSGSRARTATAEMPKAPCVRDSERTRLLLSAAAAAGNWAIITGFHRSCFCRRRQLEQCAVSYIFNAARPHA